MAIKITLIPEEDLETFASRNNLELEVVERGTKFNTGTRILTKFYAHSKGVEVKDGCLLRGVYGNGETPDKALQDLAINWSQKYLVINAFGKDRKEIQAPKLTYHT